MTEPRMPEPRITDNDKDEITAIVAGNFGVRTWSYKDDAERRMKMVMAHEFAEGWYLARKYELTRMKSKIDTVLDVVISDVKRGYDDSIFGFNEAWDLVRKVFDSEKEETNDEQRTSRHRRRGPRRNRKGLAPP